MEEESIVYKHWITGEEYTHKLSFSHPGEQKTELLCPLDSTPLIFQYDDMSKIVYCPNCEIIYPGTGNQEIINKSFEKHLEKLKEKLVNIEKEKKNIEFLLNRVRQNKANLSEKDRFDYSSSNPEKLAQIAFSINETAQKNKSHKSNEKNSKLDTSITNACYDP